MNNRRRSGAGLAWTPSGAPLPVAVEHARAATPIYEYIVAAASARPQLNRLPSRPCRLEDMLLLTDAPVTTGALDWNKTAGTIGLPFSNSLPLLCWVLNLAICVDSFRVVYEVTHTKPTSGSDMLVNQLSLRSVCTTVP